MPRYQALTDLDVRPLGPCKVAKDPSTLLYLICETDFMFWRLYSIEWHIALSYECQWIMVGAVQAYFDAVF
jgi:hypothetical protein